MLSALTLLLDTQLTAEQSELTGVIQQSGDLLLQVINDSMPSPITELTCLESMAECVSISFPLPTFIRLELTL